MITKFGNHFYHIMVFWLDFVHFKIFRTLQVIRWVGVGGFSKVVATFNHVGGS